MTEAQLIQELNAAVNGNRSMSNDALVATTDMIALAIAHNAKDRIVFTIDGAHVIFKALTDLLIMANIPRSTS